MWGIVVLFWLLCLVALYGAWCAVRLIPVFDSRNHERWSSSAYQPDARLGVAPIPNCKVYQRLADGEDVPVCFDKHGFRVPDKQIENLEDDPRPRFLFLGCSFTHGYGVHAEQTFAELVAGSFGARALNAGISGAGLSQMVLRARSDIPKFKPKIVVAQYSPWLAQRSTRLYGNWMTRAGYVPLPYYFLNNGGLEIAPPPFYTDRFIRRGERSAKALLTEEGPQILKNLVKDDIRALGFFVSSMLGLRPRPTTDTRSIEQEAYRELKAICDANGAKLIVVELPKQLSDQPPVSSLNSDLHLIQTRPALTAALSKKSEEEWTATYAIWRGSPPRLVDRHPNARMHEVIASVLSQGLEELDFSGTTTNSD